MDAVTVKLMFNTSSNLLLKVLLCDLINKSSYMSTLYYKMHILMQRIILLEINYLRTYDFKSPLLSSSIYNIIDKKYVY